MSDLQDIGHAVYKVSARGQFSLPATARERWGLKGGGEVEVFDLGSCVVMLPTGSKSARASLAAVLTADAYRARVQAIDDPDLRDE